MTVLAPVEATVTRLPTATRRKVRNPPLWHRECDRTNVAFLSDARTARRSRAAEAKWEACGRAQPALSMEGAAIIALATAMFAHTDSKRLYLAAMTALADTANATSDPRGPLHAAAKLLDDAYVAARCARARDQ